MQISQSEYLKPADKAIDEVAFLNRLKAFALNGDFASINREIENVARN